MSVQTARRPGIHRSGNRHQDRGFVASVVYRTQRQTFEPEDRAAPKRPAAAAQCLQLDRPADHDYELVLPLGLVVRTLAARGDADHAALESAAGHHSQDGLRGRKSSVPRMRCMATTADRTPAVDHELESHRRELTGYCYRMLGSGFEAEDAVQETFVRAWRNYDGFEGRSSLRSWLNRIATNVCLDMLQGPQRRARPMDMGPAATADSSIGAALTESAWVLPIADATALPEDGDPAELAAQREALRLAFVAALQHLPPRQRAVLILREVLRWQASEVAELLDTSTASVNSALQRARAQLSEGDLTPDSPVEPLDDAHRELLDRYVAAFENYDMDALTGLLQEDATLSMPP